MFVRDDAAGYVVVDEWDGGFGWQPHPEEGGRRTSHAVRARDGVWLFDPLDAPGIDDRIEALGEVAGVAVLSSYHARDADAFARRREIPVTVPTWVQRAARRIEAPVDRVEDGVAGFELARLRPLRAWEEAVAYRPRDGTLYVPDFLAGEKFTVGDERLGMPFLSRLAPPRERFEGYEPERILLGHGTGVFEDAGGVLSATMADARRRFPRALLNAPTELWAMASALR